MPISAFSTTLSMVLSILLCIPSVNPNPRSLISSINWSKFGALYFSMWTTGPNTSFFKSDSFSISINVGGIKLPWFKFISVWKTLSNFFIWLLILLNASALDVNGQASDVTGINLATDSDADTYGNNPTRLYNAISSSFGTSTTVGVRSNIFELNSQETISSDYVFIRARNNEFNYTENPSFISGSTGEVIYSYFINNPQTFPTTVGLYNDNSDLLAVAKLSRPIQKDFTKEALVRVKLDF